MKKCMLVLVMSALMSSLLAVETNNINWSSFPSDSSDYYNVDNGAVILQCFCDEYKCSVVADGRCNSNILALASWAVGSGKDVWVLSGTGMGPSCFGIRTKYLKFDTNGGLVEVGACFMESKEFKAIKDKALKAAQSAWAKENEISVEEAEAGYLKYKKYKEKNKSPDSTNRPDRFGSLRERRMQKMTERGEAERNAREEADRIDASTKAFLDEYVGIKFGADITTVKGAVHEFGDFWHVKMLKPFGYYNRVGLWCKHGKVWQITMQALFDKKYSKKSVKTECEKSKKDLFARLGCTNCSNTEIGYMNIKTKIKVISSGVGESNKGYIASIDFIDDEARENAQKESDSTKLTLPSPDDAEGKKIIEEQNGEATKPGVTGSLRERQMQKIKLREKEAEMLREEEQREEEIEQRRQQRAHIQEKLKKAREARMAQKAAGKEAAADKE